MTGFNKVCNLFFLHINIWFFNQKHPKSARKCRNELCLGLSVGFPFDTDELWKEKTRHDGSTNIKKHCPKAGIIVCSWWSPRRKPLGLQVSNLEAPLSISGFYFCLISWSYFDFFGWLAKIDQGKCGYEAVHYSNHLLNKMYSFTFLPSSCL